MPSLFQAYSKLLAAYSKLFQLIPAYAQPIPSLFQAYSKLPPSLFRAIPCVFQAIPNVFQAIPALFQAIPRFPQEICGIHFLIIVPFTKICISAFLRFWGVGGTAEHKICNSIAFLEIGCPAGSHPRMVPNTLKSIDFLGRS